MALEPSCMDCKWCNYNQLPWWKVLYYDINRFERLYPECYHPLVFWTHDGVIKHHLCYTARADHLDRADITWCGTTPKYFEPK